MKASPLTAIFEALGFGFDVRNRMKKDDDGDGVGDQTAVQSVTVRERIQLLV